MKAIVVVLCLAAAVGAVRARRLWPAALAVPLTAGVARAQTELPLIPEHDFAEMVRPVACR